MLTDNTTEFLVFATGLPQAELQVNTLPRDVSTGQHCYSRRQRMAGAGGIVATGLVNPREDALRAPGDAHGSPPSAR